MSLWESLADVRVRLDPPGTLSLTTVHIIILSVTRVSFVPTVRRLSQDGSSEITAKIYHKRNDVIDIDDVQSIVRRFEKSQARLSRVHVNMNTTRGSRQQVVSCARVIFEQRHFF